MTTRIYDQTIEKACEARREQYPSQECRRISKSVNRNLLKKLRRPSPGVVNAIRDSRTFISSAPGGLVDSAAGHSIISFDFSY